MKQKSRKMIFLINVVLLGLILFILLVTVNFASRTLLRGRHIDLTTIRKYTLSERTKQILARLEHDLSIYYLSPAFIYVMPLEEARMQARKRLEELMEEYMRSCEFIKFKVISEVDEREFEIIKKEFGQPQPHSIFFMYKISPESVRKSTLMLDDLYIPHFLPDQTVTLNFMGEYEITNAIYSLLEPKTYKFYYTRGHNELDIKNPAKSEKERLTIIERTLGSRENVTFESIDLRISDIPPDCDVLIILSPVIPFDKEEIEKIHRYLEHGGKLFIAFKPGTDAELNSLIKQWGIEYKKDKVLATFATLMGQPYIEWSAISNFVHEHAINQRVPANFIYYFPLTGFFQTKESEKSPDILQRGVLSLRTGPQSDTNCIVVDYQEYKRATTDPLKYWELLQRKPETKDNFYYLVCSAESAKKGNESQTKLLLWASSDALSDANLAPRGIERTPWIEYLLNNFRWLLEKEVIHIPTERVEMKPLRLNAKEQENILIITVLVMPGLGIFLGFITFLLRRK